MQTLLSLPANVILFPGYVPSVPVTARPRTRIVEAPVVPEAVEVRRSAIRDEKEQAQAIALHAALAKVDLSKVPVMTTERGNRKLRASLARELFRKLGLKGISVTAPNYSMAQSVHVRQPERQDRELNEEGFYDADGAVNIANREAADKIESILLAAMPNTDNRSDYSTDYFDSCWSLR